MAFSPNLRVILALLDENDNAIFDA
jgi:hypothetical protein